MANKKTYYSVCTPHEKVWIYADLSFVEDGCLVFYNLNESNEQVLIASFAPAYWQYCYQADPETGESIPEQLPFWKRHSNGNSGAARHPRPQQ